LGFLVSGDEIRIRMYNVGFGDAFLVHIPTADGERRVLIDCGQHLGGIANPMNAVLEDLIAAVTVDGKPRIDVVIATHRHFDHISGFDSKKWEAVEVGEVWLPWTERRGDPEADAVRTSQHRLAAALRARFADHNTAVGWLALNSFGNAGAERTLLQGFVGVEQRRYLPPADRADRTFSSSALPGVTVHALGPSRDPAVIATMIPPDEQAYRALAALDASRTRSRARTRAPLADVGSLFSDRYIRTPAQFARAHPALADDAAIDEVTAAAEEDLFGAASAMEDAINGTSLMLLFEIGDQRILFAGDAEWGTWNEALADPEWRELFGRVTVYKVSHHGSFNGTPKGFADDLLPKDAISLMSFHKVEKWPSIPRKSLLEALAAHDRTLIRSDKMPAAGGKLTRNKKLWIELAVPVGD
jgi:beta-lactamase superfamily II metal-dependent hydrolase